MSKYQYSKDIIYSQVFNSEILEYFDSITTKENNIWIDKYFNVLLQNNNETAEKFNIHHIRPCCTFKDETHRNRKESKPLADKINGNLIKLSIYNHLFAHFYLWKIFNNQDTKKSFQRMCGQGKYIDNLTENELKDIARLKENCAKKNGNKKEYNKRYSDKNKIIIKLKAKEYRIKNKDKIQKYNNEYNKSTKRKAVVKKYYETHKNESFYKNRQKLYKEGKGRLRRQELNKRRYYDPKTENYYSHRNIAWRLNEFPQLYENMTINDFRCISVEDEEYINWKKYKEETSLKNNKKRRKEYKIKYREKRNRQARERHIKNREHDLELNKKLRNRLCYDPIEKEPCTYGQLRNRIYRHKDKYGNIKLKDCLIIK